MVSQRGARRKRRNQNRLPEQPWGGTELEAATKIEAVFINRMIATNTPVGMRLSFGELSTMEGQPPYFRISVMISYDDAESLSALIQRQLALVKRVAFKVGPDGEIIPATE